MSETNNKFGKNDIYKLLNDLEFRVIDTDYEGYLIIYSCNEKIMSELESKYNLKKIPE